MVEQVRTLTIWRLHVVYWISKPTRAEAQASGRVSHQPTHSPPPPHTHTQICNTCLLFHCNYCSRTRLNVTLHVYLFTLSLFSDQLPYNI
jgi:hypothetical protein